MRVDLNNHQLQIEDNMPHKPTKKKVSIVLHKKKFMLIYTHYIILDVVAYQCVQAGEPPRPRRRPCKVPQPIPPLPASAIDDRDGNPIESCLHVDKDSLLQPKHMHDNP